MDIKKFITESRAVSPVIGVILMVAITVILAAVIGTFVLGLGNQVGDTAPQTSFSFDVVDNAGNSTLQITHESGDAIKAARLTVSGDALGATQNSTPWTGAGYTDVTAGTTVTVDIDNSLSGGESVRVVWTSESGSTSSTLQKWTYNA